MSSDDPIELRQIDNRRTGSMTATHANSGVYIRIIDIRRRPKERFTSPPADDLCSRHDLKAKFARGPQQPLSEEPGHE